MKSRQLKALLREHFGPDTDITRRWLMGGFEIETALRGKATVNCDGEFSRLRGSDIYVPMLKVLRALHGPIITLRAPVHKIMHAVMAAQRMGITIKPEGQEYFFGLLKDPPPSIPLPSGTGIATDEHLRRAGLTTAPWGHGLRIAEDNSANIIRYTGQNSILVIGPPGSGKQRMLLTAMIVEAENTSLFILDPKSELLPVTLRRRKELGPCRFLMPYRDGLPAECAHYADETDSYNPLVLLDPTKDGYVALCDTFGTLLIVPDGGEGKDSFFIENAQSAVSGIIMQLVENYPDKATLPEVASIVLGPGEKVGRIFEFARTAMLTGSAYVKERLATFGAADAPMMKGGINDILRTLRGQLKWLSDPAMARVLQTPKTPWRFDDLKRGPRPSTVYTCVSPKFSDVARPLFRVLLGAQFLELQSTPPGELPAAAIADEFPMLKKVGLFSTIFAEARGHGFKVVAIAQTTAQLQETYGQQGLRNFLTGSEIQVYFPPRDIQTAREIAAIAGTKIVVTKNQSLSKDGEGWSQVGYGQATEDVLTPHDVMGMSKDQLVIAAPGLVKDIIIARRRNFSEYPEIDVLTDPNPYAPSDRRTPLPEPTFIPPSFWENLYDDFRERISLWEEVCDKFAARIAPHVLKGESLDRWLDIGSAENSGWNVFLAFFFRMCWWQVSRRGA